MIVDSPPAPVRAPSRWDRLRDSPRLVSALCLAAMLGQAGIVLTGAAVRLTGSGLGCPTWPKCTDDSYVNTPEFGIHGYIEFGNRLLTFVLSAAVGLAIIATIIQKRRRRVLIMLAIAQFFGIAGQGVVGGLTVLTNLNPWVVSLHFLLSVLLVYAGFALWKRSREGDGPREFLVPTAAVWLARVLTMSVVATIVLGTIVTGSGPHSGDKGAKRNGLDPETVSQFHADAVFLLLGLTVATLLAMIALKKPVLIKAVAILLAVELSQGFIGFFQYFTGLPVLAVWLHMLGACLLWIAVLSVLFHTRTRPLVR